MALAVDASSPARVAGATTNGTLVVTTASFTPPSGTVLVATCQANARTNGGGNGVGTGAVTNSGTALTWTKINERNLADSGGLSGYAGIFVAVLTTSQAMTATLTMTAGTNSNDINTPTIKVYVVTGADTATPNGGTAEGSSTTNAITTTAFTTVGASSLGFVSGDEWQALGTPVSSDCTSDAGGAAGVSISYLSGYKVLGAAGSSATFNLDAAGTAAAAWDWVSAEIKAAPAAVALAFAPSRRRVGAPPRKALDGRARVSSPVQAQVNPPIDPSPEPRARGRAFGRQTFLRRRVWEPPKPVTTAPVGVFVAAQPRRDKFARMLPVLRRRPVSVDVAVMVQAAPPTKPRMPRRRRLPYLQGASVDAAPPQLAPPRPRSAPRMRRWMFPRTGAAQMPPPPSAPVPPAYPPAYVRGLRWVLAPVRRARVAGPVQGQSAAPSHNPPAPRRRVEPVARRGRAVAVPPPQAAAPATPPVTQMAARVRRVMTGPRRGKSAAPTPAQQAAPVNPPITQLAARGRRFAVRARRGVAPAPVPPQLVPAAPLYVPQSRRLLRPALPGRRGRAVTAAPPQAAPPAVPAVVRRRLRGALAALRRGRAAVGRLIGAGAPPYVRPGDLEQANRPTPDLTVQQVNRAGIATTTATAGGLRQATRPAGDLAGSDRPTPGITKGG